MANVTIVQGHPDPSETHLNRALASRYAQAIRAAGNEVRCIDVGRMEFPMLRRPEEFSEGPVAPEIREAQRDIAWADHVTFFYPLWLGDVPSALKAFFEQVFRPGFALEYGGRENRFPKGLLRGRSARIVVTMGMPAVVYRTAFGAHSARLLKLNLHMAGIKPVHQTFIGGVGSASECVREQWFSRIAKLAERDARPPHRRKLIAVAAASAAAALGLAAAAYGTYAAVTFARFGRRKYASALLDRVMPEYDVHLVHETKIAAPPDVAFDAITRTSIDKSPIVQALFRVRTILMRGRDDSRPLPPGLLRQFDSFGWRAIAEAPGRELLFGAVTQPWVANPVFRGLPTEEFIRFADPGFAKLAFTLRIEPSTDGHCIARTETRVQTTDAVSRARFRRYWALLSPGMELIRIVLLQQIKAEAESLSATAAR
jgi:putative NADPH-quinone reductase